MMHANCAGRMIVLAATVALLGFRDMCDASSCVPPASGINIRADIDGRSRLIIRGNTLQWQHFDAAAPGREPPTDQPTFVNCVPWFPTWPDRPNRRNNACDGCRSSILQPDALLPPVALFSGFEAVSCREHCAVVETPSAANGFTLVIEFNDNDHSGSAVYEVNVLVAPLVLNIDPFRCDEVKPSKGGPAFTPSPGLTIVDPAFAETREVSAAKQGGLCLPADLNAEGTLDAVTHVERYKLKAAKGQPQHAKRAGLVFVNRLGAAVFDTVSPTLLLLPTAKDLVAPPAAPDFASHEVDRYQCYTVKLNKGQPKLPKGLTVAIGDQFTTPAKRLLVKKPVRVCTPVEVNAVGAKHPEGLVCYRVAPSKGRCDGMAPVNAGGACKADTDCGVPKGTGLCVRQAKFAKIPGVYVANELGDERLDVTKEGEVCIPSVRLP